MKTITKKLKTRIEIRNEKFKKANAAKKRRMIVLDVIDMIKKERFLPTKGAYCIFDSDEVTSIRANFEEQGIREHFLAKNLSNCEVCGIGALMLGTILFQNKVNIIHGLVYNYSSDCNALPAVKQVRKYFSIEQLKLIEIAFEVWLEVDNNGSNNAYMFGLKYNNPKERLLAILNNMLTNKDTLFEP